MSKLTPEPADDEISRVAYGIWEKEGRPHGRDLDHWVMARQRVAALDFSEAIVTEAQPGNDASSEEVADQTGEANDHSYVRPAGRKKMDIPPATWSITDEELDESFPASDPPGNY